MLCGSVERDRFGFSTLRMWLRISAKASGNRRTRKASRASGRELSSARCGGRSSMNLIPGRIGQANEPTSPSAPPAPRRRIREPGGSRPSRPRTRSPLPRRAAARRLVLRSWGWRSLGTVPRTYGVVHGDGQGCGLAGNRQLRHKEGVIPVVPISAQAFMCRLMSSGFELSWLPSRTGYACGSARHGIGNAHQFGTRDFGTSEHLDTGPLPGRTRPLRLVLLGRHLRGTVVRILGQSASHQPVTGGALPRLPDASAIQRELTHLVLRSNFRVK